MFSPSFYRFLADMVLVVHTSFVGFVVVGFLLILVGPVFQWRWIYSRWFRWLHLAAIGVVVAQAWLGRLCPLTIWENELRRRAGLAGYDTSFIQYWLARLLYYDFPPWVFGAAYTIFGALVLALLWRDRSHLR